MSMIELNRSSNYSNLVLWLGLFVLTSSSGLFRWFFKGKIDWSGISEWWTVWPFFIVFDRTCKCCGFFVVTDRVNVFQFSWFSRYMWFILCDFVDLWKWRGKNAANLLCKLALTSHIMKIKKKRKKTQLARLELHRLRSLLSTCCSAVFLFCSSSWPSLSFSRLFLLLYLTRFKYTSILHSSSNSPLHTTWWRCNSTVWNWKSYKWYC